MEYNCETTYFVRQKDIAKELYDKLSLDDTDDLSLADFLKQLGYDTDSLSLCGNFNEITLTDEGELKLSAETYPDESTDFIRTLSENIGCRVDFVSVDYVNNKRRTNFVQPCMYGADYKFKDGEQATIQFKSIEDMREWLKGKLDNCDMKQIKSLCEQFSRDNDNVYYDKWQYITPFEYTLVK